MFAQMPEYFLEISNLLLEKLVIVLESNTNAHINPLSLSSAEDDVPNAEDVRRLLKDITDVRQSKIRAGLEDIKSSVVVNVRNLTPMEINSVRPFFAASMDVFYHMASEG